MRVIPNFPWEKTFMGIRPGQFVNYLRHAGTGLNGPEYKRARGKVVMAFSQHVVVNAGGRYGIPQVVDDNNYLPNKRKNR